MRADLRMPPLPPSAGISRFRFNGSWGATPTSQPLGSPGMGRRLGELGGDGNGLCLACGDRREIRGDGRDSITRGFGRVA